MPASVINSSPFSQPWGSSIYVKVAASNLYGMSAYSTAGNGAIILTVPDAPVNVANNPLVTNTSRVGIVWSAGSSNGGTAVIDYRVSWDQGTGTWVVR